MTVQQPRPLILGGRRDNVIDFLEKACFCNLQLYACVIVVAAPAFHTWQALSTVTRNEQNTLCVGLSRHSVHWPSFNVHLRAKIGLV